jgi:alpha-tubulin suppressor-like RCC1 family protein
VAAGVVHSLALDEVGRCYGWGSGRYGQIGDKLHDAMLTPFLIDTFV